MRSAADNRSLMTGLLRARCEGRLEAERKNRLSWWSHWGELAEYFLPRRYNWLVTPNKADRGSPINGRIIDESGTLAWRALASGLMQGITSPGRPWYELTIDNADLADRWDVKIWLQSVTKRMQAVMAGSNYYTAKATQFGDLSMFGTAPLIIEEDFDEVINCTTPCAGEYFVINDHRKRVGGLYREMVMTVDQMCERFGDAVPQRIRLLRKGSAGGATEYIVAHAIEANDDELGEMKGFVVPAKFPFRSLYWLRTGGRDDGFLECSGYHEWPAPTPRWDQASNDAYGRSPAMDALGSQKQLWMLNIRLAQAIDKMVNPPLLADMILKDQKTSSLPGGITYVAGLAATPGMKSVYDVRLDIPAMKELIADVRGRIDQVFFKDLFLMISQLDTVRSATEIDARREEKLIQIGPMYERFQNESLDPDIDRIFAIMNRKKLFPPAPKAIHGMPLTVKYISVLAQQLRAAQTAAIERLLQFLGNLAALNPDILDTVDMDQTVQIYADMLGVPAQLVRDAPTIAKLRAAKAKQAQQAQMERMTPQMVAGAKVLSQTDLGGGQNALAAIMGANQSPGMQAAA